ncbi:MAG: amidohydrolase family protein, partial [Anaerolineae bacterium]|nr:amidohydrolase family protein [Anaerolineae bacterium]
EVSDRDGPAAAAAGIEENTRFLASAEARTPLVRGMFGLHASMTLSDGTIRRAAEAAATHEAGFHVHVAESQADVRDTLKLHGLRVVERWSRLGVLGPRTIAAHCVHVDRLEMDLLRRTHTFVAHNPRSNMNNAVGVADVPAMLRMGLRVGLGNDGFPQDLFQELQAAYLLPKQATGDPRAGYGPAIVDLLLRHNAALASAAFGVTLGSVEVGAAADLILVHYQPPTPVSGGNLAWHILFGLGGSSVDTTIVNGRVLMRKGQLQTLDEEAIAARGRELAAALWRRV